MIYRESQDTVRTLRTQPHKPNKMTPTTTRPIRTGHAGMIQWNPTFRAHHLPVPFKVRIRSAAIAAGRWTPCLSSHTEGLRYPLWDHWGSVILDGDTERSVISQPYAICDTEARAFATRHGFLLTIRCTAPWHPGATFYAFTIPNP